ncbi:HAD-IIIC family phosphatase [Microbulbifer sp. ZKSA006]|uniref:HAD-IIIC family phosphatase n=1 Tax=Microbulbifer sp. ZKSA006 TaxID=3243390 RepID=UPI00403A7C71
MKKNSTTVWKIVSNYNMDIFSRFLKRDSIAEDVTPSLYNNVYEELFFSTFNADILLIWLDLNIFPTYRNRKSECTITLDSIEDEVNKFLSYIDNIKNKYKNVIFVNWDDYFNYRGDGSANYCKHGASYLIDRIRLKTAERYLEDNQVLIVDFKHIKEKVGGYGLDEKLYYATKCPFSVDFLNVATSEIGAAIDCLKGQQKKLIVLDLDNTLWGGVIGDDGISGIRLGGHDSVGESFVDFQEELKNLSNSGCQLAICSKNYESVALDCISKHPDMVLRESDFVAKRINWEPKSSNISNIVGDINIGLQSVVFLDDSAYERSDVSNTLKGVLVPEMPDQPYFYKRILKELRCFDRLFETDEDKKRTEMYRVEAKRQSDFATATIDRDTWLKGLSLELRGEPLSDESRERCLQLLNKTNQFNLSGKRYTEIEFHENLDKHSVLNYRCSDKFGDYGIIAVVIYKMAGEVMEIIDFVMSCRVMARGVESAIIATLAEEAKIKNLKEIHVRYINTDRNIAIKEFLDKNLEPLEGKNSVYLISDLDNVSMPGYIKAIFEPEHSYGLV